MNLCIGNSAAPGNAFQPSALVASISAPKLSDAESIRLILSAVDGGITFMDNCWDYNQGQSEIRMGEALKEGYRQKVFLMSKLDGRTKAKPQRSWMSRCAAYKPTISDRVLDLRIRGIAFRHSP